jgi:hypothetical protein
MFAHGEDRGITVFPLPDTASGELRVFCCCSTKGVCGMFGFVRLVSAVIGVLVIIQAAALALICALVATPFTLVLGAIGGVVMGLGGALGGEQVENAALKTASDFSWATGRWAFDVTSVLIERFTKFLNGGTASSQEVNSHPIAIVRDWPAWSWHLIVGDTYTMSGRDNIYATARRVGVFPSRRAAESALREKRDSLGAGRALTSQEAKCVEAEVAKIESVKRTSANVMIAIVLVVDLLGIISLVVLLSV